MAHLLFSLSRLLIPSVLVSAFKAFTSRGMASLNSLRCS
jgi:hypothetical protein